MIISKLSTKGGQNYLGGAINNGNRNEWSPIQSSNHTSD